MKVIDPGHHYALNVLDYGPDAITSIRFVKRVGPKYPGNVGASSGTTLQEVLRACHDRLGYVGRQLPCWQTTACRWLLGLVVWLLEWRAARRHGRLIPCMREAVYGYTCWRCGHVGHICDPPVETERP